MPFELKIPEVGESITQVEIGEWLKSEGDQAEKDEDVVVIETEKATFELSAPVSGIITKVLKQKGEPASVGEVIGYMEEGKAAEQKIETAAETRAEEAGKAEEKPKDFQKEEERKEFETRAAKPRVLSGREATTERRREPDEVATRGPGERLLGPDEVRPMEPRPEYRKAERAQFKAAPRRPRPPLSREEEAVPLSPMRRQIAKRLVEAQQTAALLTTFNEIDMSEVNSLREQYQAPFQERYEIKLGLMSFFAKAAIDALQLIPQLNAEIRGDLVVYRSYYDIGVAVGSGKGLVVPVLRNAETMSFAEIELAIADFARRAQENQLKLEELQGGTFTISNGGVYGSLLSTPIVNPPQSGILGMHAIQQRPVAREGVVVIRPMMYVALTYDHRIVDGREAVTFLRHIKDAIEDPARMLLEI
ncbi:MAG: 2-oxoglutarate dehydrogenase complex dihydrolipoyllysine-residue succinyltransferase [Deltaproteobacteria bacterium]|nr:2-oxoglutarate dehydrogenase complex dihydrolipoyllysine-residue succinyltransferase [Deltaproteobacteria bacterium]